MGIGFVNDGKIEQIAVFGELQASKPAPVNTIWNVASMTKPITAIVALKLIDAGKWDLDEPVYKYYTDPDIANDPRAKLLTTRIILSHQTGFSNCVVIILTESYLLNLSLEQNINIRVKDMNTCEKH